MADRKISDLTALTTPASGDFLPIVDISEAAAASKNKKITYSDFLNNIPTGTITSTMILDGTILNADINASAAIVDTKLATIATGGKVSNSATTATDANTASAIVARDGSGNFTAGTITANLTGTASNVTTNANLTGDVTSVGNATSIAAGVIVNADINASAAIVDTKLATIATAGKVSNSATTATDANTASAIVARDGSGNFTAGTITAALTGAASSNVLKAGDTMTGALVVPLASAATPSLTFTGDLNTGIYSPGADQVAISTNGTGRLFVDANGKVSARRARSNTSGQVGLEIAPSDSTVAYGFRQDSSANSFFLDRVDIASTLLSVTSAGLVGIGTSAPTSTLHIQHAAQTAGYWEGKGLLIHEDATANEGIALYSRGGNEQYIASLADDADSYLVIGTRKSSSVNEVNAITIRGDGKVGIGTTSPGSALEINAAAATSPFIAKINTAEVARVDSSGRLLVGASADSGGARLQVNGDRIRVATAKTPASAADTGTAGEICWDADYIYVCTATNTWKRSAIATW